MRRAGLSTARRSGFTIVELLVVMAVIAILASITIPVISGVKTRQKAKSTKLLIEQLKLALDAYANDFGDYPPSDPKVLGLPSNGVNDGIECLVRCLSTKKKKGPYYEFKDEELANTDHDLATANPTDSIMTTRELFEVVDAFGHPLVYMHNADYDRGQKVQVEDEVVPVKGCKSAKTGQYQDLTKFQLRSLGANGKDDDGQDDDITSWSTGN